MEVSIMGEVRVNIINESSALENEKSKNGQGNSKL